MDVVDGIADVMEMFEPDGDGPNAAPTEAIYAADNEAVSPPTILRATILTLPGLWWLIRDAKPKMDGVWDLLPHFSTKFLCALLVIVTYYTQATNPAKCASPPHFSAEYVDIYCGGHSYILYSTLWRKYHNHMGNKYSSTDIEVPMSLYAYFPLMFGVLALICYLPQLIWKLMNCCSRIRMARFVECQEKYLEEEIIGAGKENMVLKLVVFKVASLSLSLGLVMLMYYAVFPYDRYTVPIFPKEVLCNLIAVEQNQYLNHKISCLLPQNHYNEQVCIILAAWFAFVALANVFSIIGWIVCLSRWFMLHVFGHFENSGTFHMNQVYSFLSYTQIVIIATLWSKGHFTRAGELIKACVRLYNKENNILAQQNVNGHHGADVVDEPESESEAED